MGQRHRAERGIDDQIVAADQSVIERAEHRHIVHCCRTRQIDRHEARLCRQARRLAAAMKPGVAEHDRQARGQHVEGEAADDLVAALGDARISMHQRKGAGDGNAGGERNPRRIAKGSHCCGAKGAGQHLALEADVDNAGTLGKEPGQGAEDQRSGDPQGGAQDQHDDGDGVFHLRRSAMPALAVKAGRRATRTRVG